MDDEKLKVILGNTVSSSSAKSIRNLISLKKKKTIDGQIGMVSINLFLGYFVLFYFMYGLMQPRLVLNS